MAVRTVTASFYGGPTDPTSGTTGYKGDNLYQHPDSFAELSTNPTAAVSQLDFAALGGLPYMAAVKVTNPANNQSLTLYKRDVGAGGPGLQGYPRAIDLWYSAAQKLGVNGLAVVQVDTGARGGGTFGSGGTGTPANQTPAPTSLWTVGDAANPDEDYFTCINRWSMDAQWYCFSDAETLFVADGIQLMAQTPQQVIVRTSPNVIHAECLYDNTAFTYAATHRKKARIVRRTSLARLTSPTSVTVRIVCDIDQFRAGDTVFLKLFGPADGIWLIGNTVRDCFLPYTDLTLVQAMQPINAVTGTQAPIPYQTGPAASQPGSGTVIAAMISEAATINNSNYPYVYGGGHGQAGTPSVGVPGGNGYDGHTQGFDCSGAVAAVLAAGGLWQWGSSVPADSGIVQQLLSQNKVVPGQGTGQPECTLFDYPGRHIFMRLNGQYFGTESGDLAGPNTALPDNGWGVGWMRNGSPGGAQPYNVPAAILGQVAGATGGVPSSTTVSSLTNPGAVGAGH